MANSDSTKSSADTALIALEKYESFKSKYNNKSLEQLQKILESYNQKLTDPIKAASLSKTEVQEITYVNSLIATKAGTGKLKQIYEKRTKQIQQTLIQTGKKKYKYNILTTSPNQFLVDIRNFYNFRSTRDNMATGTNTAITATASVQAGTNPSKSYYMTAGDFLFAEDFNLNTQVNKSIQYAKLIINEKQPSEVLHVGSVIDKAVDVANSKIGKKGSNIINKAINVIGDAAETAKPAITNYLTTRYSINPALLYGNDGDASKSPAGNFDPINLYRKLFHAGNWLNTYQVPYFSNDYLDAKLASKWTLGNSEKDLGSSLKSVATGFGADYPTRPTFELGNINNTCRSNVSTEFYLINKNQLWLHKNFQFLHAIFAGANWIHMTAGIVKSSNVYHVLCPDRFQIFWAAMDVTITIQGKLRKNISMFQKYGHKIKSITPQSLWPQAWKIKLDFKSLVPQNFNTYIEYFIHGFGDDQIKLMQGNDSFASIKLAFMNNTFNVTDNAATKWASDMLGIKDGNKELIDDIQGVLVKQQRSRYGTSVGVLSDSQALSQKQYNSLMADINAGKTLSGEQKEQVARLQQTLQNRKNAINQMLGTATTQEDRILEQAIAKDQLKSLDSQLAALDKASTRKAGDK